MWITLEPWCRELNDGFKYAVRSLLREVKAFIKELYVMSEDRAAEIELTKIDATVDYLGSFLPEDATSAYNSIKDRLKQVMKDKKIIESLSFFSHRFKNTIQIVNGDERLDSMFKFNVKDALKSRVITIKLYDKLLDFISREARDPVGSRTSIVLGARRNQNEDQ